MAFSSISLDFSRLVNPAEFITFSYRDLDINGGNSPIITDETCALVRTGFGLFEYDKTGDITGIRSSLSYATAWNADYNSQNLFSISYSATAVVTITAKKDNIEFFNFDSTGGVVATIDNGVVLPTFLIDSIEYLPALTANCTNVRVRVTTTNPMLRITSPVFIDNVNSNVVEFDYARNAAIFISVADINYTRALAVRTKDFLATPTVSYSTSPSGATVTISVASSSGTINALTDLTYSLDGVNYKLSRVFSGILDGTFTAYVKDTYGCVKTTEFIVESFTPDVGRGVPTSFVSNTNSIRFKKNETWNNNTIFRNDTNTLSYEEKAILRVPYIHKFIDSDVVQVQFKTNYETVVASVYNCTTKVTSNLVVLPITDNLNKADKRDAIGYEFPDGIRYGFYFQVGNVYDPNQPTDVITGDYSLYGALPAWAKIGAFIDVNGDSYAKIVDITFVDELSSYVIVTDNSFAGMPTNAILTARYNVFNWNAFEFSIDMSAHLNEEIQVTIQLTDSEFDTVTYISEKIQVYSDLDDMITIKSKNTTNNDIVYQSGIEHISRLEYDLYSLSDESELEIQKGDNTVYQLSTYSYAKKKLMLTRLSTVIARSIRQQLSLDTIVIDGVTCKIEEIGEPTRIGVSNVYKMEVTLYEVEDRISSAEVDTDVELDILDIPALVLGNNEFIKQ